MKMLSMSCGGHFPDDFPYDFEDDFEDDFDDYEDEEDNEDKKIFYSQNTSSYLSGKKGQFQSAKPL